VSTTVTARQARSIGYASFEVLLPGVTVTEIRPDSVTFDADLTPEQQQAVRDRMTSRDDDDQNARANIATLRTAAAAPTATTDDVKALALAVSAYLLGIETP
jgi:hypothetical protein